MENWLKPFSAWIGKGVACKVLLVKGGGWQKGKIRIRFEFIPDSPPPEPNETLIAQTHHQGTVYVLPAPSPLDELRRQLDIQ
ncbi:MAG: KGK domain-containing protein [Nostoc sp. ZfuVER08]|nr:KGK domain-containing protein [Nostoc sp. ZfuVER08]